MKDSKKSTVRLLIAAGAATAMLLPLAACGSTKDGSASSAKSETKITFYSYFNKSQIGDVIKAFEKENPNIKIDFQFAPDSNAYLQTLQTRISGNQAPTVFNITMDNRTDIINAGAAADLKGEKFLEGIDPANFNVFSKDGKIYGMPVSAWLGAMFYNKDILKAAGYDTFPKTWDDFVAMGKKINSMGKTAFLEDFNTQPSGTLEALIASYYASKGEKTQDEVIYSGKSTFEKEWTGPITEWQKAITAGVLPTKSVGLDANAVKQQFITGNLAVMRSGPWDLKDIQASGVKFGVAPMPSYQNGEQWINGGPDQGFAISSKATGDQKKAAEKFLSFINSAKGLELFTKAAGTMSLSKKYESQAPDELKSVVKDYLLKGKYYWINFSKNSTALTATMRAKQQELVQGKISPMDFAKAMDQTFNK